MKYINCPICGLLFQVSGNVKCCRACRRKAKQAKEHIAGAKDDIKTYIATLCSDNRKAGHKLTWVRIYENGCVLEENFPVEKDANNQGKVLGLFVDSTGEWETKLIRWGKADPRETGCISWCRVPDMPMLPRERGCLFG